jgi:hypothetical protein
LPEFGRLAHPRRAYGGAAARAVLSAER